jgi:fimbrial chaperone protein
MIEVAAQGSQTIRLVRTAKAAVAREESYRVLVDEITDPSAQSANGVNLQLRYSVPVFVSPAGVKPARMTVTTSADGQALMFKAQNAGGQHAQVSAVTLVNAGGDALVVEAGLVGYVLVGQTMQWRLNIPSDAAAKGPFVGLRCRINGEPFSTQL